MMKKLVKLTALLAAAALLFGAVGCSDDDGNSFLSKQKTVDVKTKDGSVTSVSSDVVFDPAGIAKAIVYGTKITVTPLRAGTTVMTIKVSGKVSGEEYKDKEVKILITVAEDGTIEYEDDDGTGGNTGSGGGGNNGGSGSGSENQDGGDGNGGSSNNGGENQGGGNNGSSGDGNNSSGGGTGSDSSNPGTGGDDIDSGKTPGNGNEGDGDGGNGGSSGNGSENQGSGGGGNNSGGGEEDDGGNPGPVNPGPVSPGTPGTGNEGENKGGEGDGDYDIPSKPGTGGNDIDSGKTPGTGNEGEDKGGEEGDGDYDIPNDIVKATAKMYDFTKWSEADLAKFGGEFYTDSKGVAKNQLKSPKGTTELSTGATIYNSTEDRIMIRTQSTTDNTPIALNYNGGQEDDDLSSGIDVSKLDRYVSIPVDGRGRIIAFVKFVKSSSGTGNLQAAFVDVDGNLLGKVVEMDVNTGGEATIEGIAVPRPVILAFSRNGAGGGGLDVYSISVAP